MATIKQGTTYPIVISIAGIDLTGADWVIVSIRPHAKQTMEFGKDQMLIAATEQGTTLTLSLTQAQSVMLSFGTATVDVNWLLDGVRGGCVPVTMSVTETLLKRVVQNG